MADAADANDKFATKEELERLTGKFENGITGLTGKLETVIATITGKLETQDGKFATNDDVKKEIRHAGYIAAIVLAIVTAAGVVANIEFREAPVPIPPELIELIAKRLASAASEDTPAQGAAREDTPAQPDALKAAASPPEFHSPSSTFPNVWPTPESVMHTLPPHREEATAPDAPALKKHPRFPPKDKFLR